MEQTNILLNFFVLLAMVIIATPNNADGNKILNYDEDAPTYPWERIVYRGNMPRIPKRAIDIDTPASRIVDIPEEADRFPTTTTVAPKTSTKDNKEKNKRIYGFEEYISELNKYGKASVIYGRVSLPVIVLSSYRDPNQ